MAGLSRSARPTVASSGRGGRRRRRSIDGAVAIAQTPPACARGARAVGCIAPPAQDITMTLPSGPAKAAEASADEAAAETVPWGMTVGADDVGDDDWSGAASRSGKRGQLAAPAISRERRSALAARGGERNRERERERERALLCSAGASSVEGEKRVPPVTRKQGAKHENEEALLSSLTLLPRLKPLTCSVFFDPPW